MNTYTRDGRTVTCEPGSPADRRMATHRGWKLVDTAQGEESDESDLLDRFVGVVEDAANIAYPGEHDAQS